VATQKVKDLFARDIHRDIREVIKVDQTDEQVIRDEIGEYVVTKTILGNFTEILEAYREAPNRPGDRMAVWISGFFGSGKSSFAKLLGLALANRTLGKDTTSGLLADHIGKNKRVLIQ
jgi:pantothenate kinase-related protein Tda10